MSAKPHLPHFPAARFSMRLPNLFNRLPISDSALRRIQSTNDTHLLRLYFGTADKNDVDALSTHLIISWGLAGRMQNAQAIRDELWNGIELISRSFPDGASQEADPLELVMLQDIVRSSLDLWRLTSVEELDRTIAEINDEFAAFHHGGKTSAVVLGTKKSSRHKK